jgi:twitching motility protein PilU
MSTKANKTAIEETTPKELTMTDPERSENTADANNPQHKGTTVDREVTDAKEENTQASQHENTGDGQPAEPENAQPISVVQQPEPSLEEAVQPAEQNTADADDVSQKNPAPDMDVKPVSDGSEGTQQVKRPYIDITPYLKLMVERHGSDMYFTCGAKVQIKINGVTMGIGKNVLPKGAVYDILPGILNERQLEEFEQEMELDTAFSLDNVGRFRINVFRQRGEVAIVIRQIHAQVPSVRDLQLPTIIESLIMEPRGLIIIAGATGTGKSTTVASMIDHRNSRRSGHILTIEDPIEFMHDHKKSIVNQREVGLDTKSFKEALRRAMREAPDVIMIGEIRDAETMHQALSYADTGHLCIATLHGTNTTQCMERILSLFPKANRDQLLMDLSLNLRALICQRLLVDVNRKRIPATEVLINEPMVQKVIRDGETHKLKDVLEKAPPESALHSFDNDMLRLFKANKVTMEEALRHVDEPDHFKLKVNLGGNGISSSGDDLY